MILSFWSCSTILKVGCCVSCVHVVACTSEWMPTYISLQSWFCWNILILHFCRLKSLLFYFIFSFIAPFIFNHRIASIWFVWPPSIVIRSLNLIFIYCFAILLSPPFFHFQILFYSSFLSSIYQISFFPFATSFVFPCCGWWLSLWSLISGSHLLSFFLQSMSFLLSLSDGPHLFF